MTERSEIAIHAITWVKLENIMLSEKKKKQKQKAKYCRILFI